MRYQQAIVFVLLVTIAAAANAATMSIETLQTRYKSLKNLTAEIEQEKTGVYLAKPLQSQIHLEYHDGHVVWETKTPVKSRVLLEGQNLKLVDASGNTKTITAKPGSKPDALLWFI